MFIFVHSFQLLFRECNYPRGFMWWIGFHAVLFWFLFWDFYKSAYRGAPSSGQKSSSSNKSSENKLASFCHLDYDQLKEDCIKKLNGVVKTQQQNGTQNEAAKNTYTNGIHKAHKNGVKCKDL